MIGRALIVPVVALLLVAPAPARTDPQQRSILFLGVEDFTRIWVRLMFESFNGVVAAEDNPPALYYESLDAARFQEQDYLVAFREWLGRKYATRRVDLIVAVGEESLGFLANGQGEPWPEAQIMFLEAGSVRPEIQAALPDAGGMLLGDHLAGLLQVIKQLVPGADQMVLIEGASPIERDRWRSYPEYVLKGGFEPTVWAGLPADQLMAGVSQLPPNTVIMLLAPSIDSRGRMLGATEACELISANASVPLFTPGAHDLGCGSVGGLGRDWSVVGRVLAVEALARLRRPSREVIHVPVPQFTSLVFDDRQLQRWGIPETRLPAGAVVRFRVPSLWRDYRGVLLTILGVTVVQSLLIAGLVFERRRRRRAEIESRRNLAALAHMDRRAAMGELATSLAHELNQPLNAILQNAGVAQMLLDATAVPEPLGEMAEIISDIRKDDLRASEVIRRMRGLLQKHELETHPVDLNDVAEETVAIVRPDAKAREILIDLALAQRVRPIGGDRVHLQQVLLNLLLNAMDAVVALPPDRRRIRVTTSDTHGEVRLAVSDSGSGIPPDRLSQIFEPFYSTKSSGSGMGMGLAIARNIVDAHGGRMAAHNNAEAGATVWFGIPADTSSGPP